MNTTTNAPSARPGATASTVLPQRKAAALSSLPAAPRLPSRVLQTSHAPAQLSLFLRPGLSAR